MPPKPKITKDIILNAVLEITRETGFETVNARSIADKLKCSTCPVFTCYKNMAELKKDFLDFAYEYYNKYVTDYSEAAKAEPYLFLPLSYIAFARQETYLFRLLFMTDMDLDVVSINDFYREAGNEEKAQTFSELVGIGPEHAKEIFLDLFLYTHGIAVLTAAGKFSLNDKTAEKMLLNFLSAFVEREKMIY